MHEHSTIREYDIEGPHIDVWAYRSLTDNPPLLAVQQESCYRRKEACFIRAQ